MSKGKGGAKGGGKAAAVADPEEVIEETPAEGSEAEAAEPAAEPETPAVDHKAEADRLRAENDELRRQQTERRQVTTTARPQVTVSDLESLTDKQWEEVEERTGKNRDAILSQARAHEARSSNLATVARLNVTDALEDLVLQEPTAARLKPFMREYLQDVPVEERADPSRLERHMAKAKVYAKGRLAEKGGYRAPTAPAATAGKVRNERGPDGGDAGSDDEEEGEEIQGGQEFDGGRMKVSHLGGKAAKRPGDFRHPTDPHGIQFKGSGPKALDKPPVFRRGE